MTIERFFKKIQDKKTDMQKALKRYVEAVEDFYTITGVKYTDMPKAKGEALGFDELMINIEDLFDKYVELRNEYKDLYNGCMVHINKLENRTYRLIIEYAYINEEDDKRLLVSLKDYHDIEYSDSHLRKLKSKAVKEFRKIIDTI